MLIMSVKLGQTNKNQEDYFIGGRSMPWVPVACSIAASTISANGFVGGPGWAYTSGMISFMLQFSIPLVMLVACNYIVPFMYNLKITSSYEYLTLRFGKATHLLGCIGYLATAATLLSGFVYIPSLVIQQLTGWSLGLIVPVVVIVVIAYTMAGGIKAVIWTDAIQMIVMWVGVIATVAIAMRGAGVGFGDVMKTAQETGMLNALDFSGDLALENGFWVALFGGIAMWLQYFAADQTQLQRMLASKSVRSAKVSIMSSGILMNVMYFVFMIIGLIMFSFYQGTAFNSSNDVMITFILNELPVGLLGLMIAAVFAAAMSSIDSVLNSMTTVFVKDIYEKYITKDGKEAPLKVNIAFTGVFGVVVVIFVLMGFSGTTASVLSTVGAYVGYIAGSLLAIFLLGMFTEKANNLGASVGFVAGLVATWACSFTALNWLWYYLVGAVVGFVVGYAVSCVVGAKKDISGMTIKGQREALIQKGTVEEDGVSILPGTMDKYGWILLAFFVVQVVVLFMFTK